MCRRSPRITALVATILLLSAMSSRIGSLGADARRETAVRLADAARRNEHVLRSRQYPRDVKYASRLWADNGPGEALKVLDNYLPSAAKDDVREFAWFYLHRLCDLARTTLVGHHGDVYSCAIFPGRQNDRYGGS